MNRLARLALPVLALALVLVPTVLIAADDWGRAPGDALAPRAVPIAPLAAPVSTRAPIPASVLPPAEVTRTPSTPMRARPILSRPPQPADRPALASEPDPRRPERPALPVTDRAYAASPDPLQWGPVRVVAPPSASAPDPSLGFASDALLALTPPLRETPSPFARVRIPDPEELIREIAIGAIPPAPVVPSVSALRPAAPPLPVTP